MAKKPLTEFDILKKQYSALVNLNDRLKYICSAYYIGYDGVVYLKSLVGFVEKIVRLHDADSLNRFFGCMVMPNALFEFKKKAKKTKLTIELKDNVYYFGQDDNEELAHQLNLVNPNKDYDEMFLEERIKPEMYKKFFSMNTDEYIPYPEEDFLMLSENDTTTLVESNPLFLHYNETELTITRHLFIDIKKNDLVGIRRLNYQNIENNSKRVCYMIKLITDIYDGYTIFNTLQS